MRRLLTAIVPAALLVWAHPAYAQRCGEPMEVAVGTPRVQIAKLLVNQMFDEIKLSDDQESKAVRIVTKWMGDRAALDRGAPDYKQRTADLDRQRDADLLTLLPKDADKVKLNACFQKMERASRGGRGGGR
jgi:hypothetical protein